MTDLSLQATLPNNETPLMIMADSGDTKGLVQHLQDLGPHVSNPQELE
jgi:hypothetical protein